MTSATLGWPVIAKLLGGVGLFLLGMTLLTEGLKALAGPRLRRTLQRVTANPLQGFVAGTAMTVLTQASSATVLATVGFVTARLLSLALAIPLVVGATVGTSSTTWVVATLGMSPGVVSVLMPLLALGALMRALGRGSVRPAGTALAGLSVLLLSIGFIRETVGPVAMALDLSSTTADGLGGAARLLAIGTLLAIAMQSSAAPIAMAMLALAGGALGWTEAAIVTVGATVGTTSTGIVATLGARPSARRVAIAWTVTALVQALVALAVRGDIDEAAGGRRPAEERPAREMGADGPQVVGEDLAQLVIRHLSEKGRAGAQARKARHRVGRGSAGGLHPRRHPRVELPAPGLVHEGHGPPGEAFSGDESLIRRGDDVDDGVADGGDVEEFGHGASLGLAKRGPATGKAGLEQCARPWHQDA